MNFSKILDDICCDDRVKNGIPNLNDPEFCFVMQEYLIKHGINESEVVDKTSTLFEAGKFPERQAYNKDGLLVTFPTKEHRDRAVDKGTHFAENPKKSDPTIFSDIDTQDSLSVADISNKQPDISTIKTDLPDDGADGKDVEDEFVTVDDYVSSGIDNVDLRDKNEKKQDSKSVENILKNDELTDELDGYTNEQIAEYLKENNFVKELNVWKNSAGEIVAEQVYDDETNSTVINYIKGKNIK